MNALNPAIELGNRHHPVNLSRRLKPMPSIVDEEIDDILFFELPDDFPEEMPVETRLPAKPPVLNLGPEHVPPSLLRRIAREIAENECDPRTVLSACHGLTRGSRRFEEAYTMARIRAFSKSQRLPSDLNAIDGSNGFSPMPVIKECSVAGQWPPPSHPMAVTSLGRLMDHFGIWVCCLLGAQLFCAWKTAVFFSGLLKSDSLFCFGAALVLTLALDSWVWLARRGKLSNQFHMPGLVLFLMALMPVSAIYLMGVLDFAD